MKKNIVKTMTFTVLLFTFIVSASAQCTGYVTIQGKNFYTDGSEYYPVGANYLVDIVEDSVTHCLYIAPNHFYGPSYDYEHFNAANSLQEIRDDFYRMKHNMGMNSVRLFGLGPIRNPSSDGFSFTANVNLLHLKKDSVDTITFSPPYSGNPAVNPNCAKLFVFIDSVLAIAAEPQIDIKVILLAGGGGIFSTNGRVDYANYLAALATNFANNTTLFAYDLSNEPGGWGSGVPNDGGYVTNKEDVCNITNLWSSAIKDNAPCQLITLGDRYAEDILKWDPGVMHLDFISFHPYPFVTDPTEHAEITLGIDRVLSQIYWYANSVNLPWMLGEIGFSAMYSPTSTSGVDGNYNGQEDFATLTLAAARSCGAAGYMWWQYQNVYWGSNLQDNFGLIDHDDILKPAVDAFLNFDPNNVQTSCTQPDYYYNPYNHPTNNGSGCHVSGSVTNYQTSSAMQDAYVGAWTSEGYNPTTHLYESDFFHTFTDANGGYSVDADNFKPNNNHTYPYTDLNFGQIAQIIISALGAERLKQGWGNVPSTYSPSLHKIDLELDGTVNNQTITTGNTQNFQAWKTLTTTDVTIETGATSEFKARYEVHLTPGFDANYGSEVHIYCAPVFAECGDLSGFQMQKTANPSVENNPNIESKKEIEVNFKEQNQTSITVSPNPSIGLFLVRLNDNDENALIKTISLFDLIGRELLTTELNNKSYLLDLSLLPKGIYLLRTTDNMNKQSNKKIIKN